MRRLLFIAAYKVGKAFNSEKLKHWAYIKWFNLFNTIYDPNIGYYKFAFDYMKHA